MVENRGRKEWKENNLENEEERDEKEKNRESLGRKPRKNKERRSPECYIPSSLEWVFFNANNLIFTFHLNLRCCYKLSTSLLFPLSL